MTRELSKEAIIKVENLSKSYVTYKRGSGFSEAVKSFFQREKVLIHAVKDVSFNIPKGSIVGILGKNGAGKSSTIKMMTGILFPTSGKIDVMGYEPFSQRSKYVAHIGAVFGQKSQLIFDIPPQDSFVMNKAIYGISDGDYKKRLDEMVAILEIEEVIKRPTRVLSLGERMKCEFVMAMLHNPQIVFLDEPTIGLDIIAKENIRNFILDMNKKGITFILTTHDIEEVEKLVDRVIVINDGEKVFEDSLAVLKKHLGNKKHMIISMKTKIPPLDLKGVDIINTISESEIEVLLDNDIIEINEFISRMNQLGDIVDLSINEMKIEEIIKHIYRS